MVARRPPDRVRACRRIRIELPVHHALRRHRSEVRPRGSQSRTSKLVARRTQHRALGGRGHRHDPIPTATGLRLVSAASQNSNPVWSPDGKWIAFDLDRVDGDESEVFIAPVAGGPARRSTQGGGAMPGLVTGRSGRRIAAEISPISKRLCGSCRQRRPATPSAQRPCSRPQLATLHRKVTSTGDRDAGRPGGEESRPPSRGREADVHVVLGFG